MDKRTHNSELEAGNYKLPLTPLHREAMLDLVLAWGTLNGAEATLLAQLVQVPYHEAADLIGKQIGSGKPAEMIRLIKQVDSAEKATKFLKKHKGLYDRHSKVKCSARITSASRTRSCMNARRICPLNARHLQTNWPKFAQRVTFKWPHQRD